MTGRDQYVESVKAEIDLWNTKLDELTARFEGDGADVETQRDHDEQMQAMRQRRDQAMTKLTKIQSSREDIEDVYEDVKDGLERFGKFMQTNLRKIISKFLS